MEALSLRVQDLDFEGHQLIIRGGKGNKDRVTGNKKRIQGPYEVFPIGVRISVEVALAKLNS